MLATLRTAHRAGRLGVHRRYWSTVQLRRDNAVLESSQGKTRTRRHVSTCSYAVPGMAETTCVRDVSKRDRSHPRTIRGMGMLIGLPCIICPRPQTLSCT